MNRRHLIASGFVLTPLAALMLPACGDEGRWPEGMLPFKWDRDTCARCSMAISDRRFAAQIRGGPKNSAFKFDDIGCAATWYATKLADQPWITEAATRFWVAEFAGQGERWLDARRAYYLEGMSSPMGYNHAAYAEPQNSGIDFDALRQKTASGP